ncbi:DUF4126 domain-containing protein [Leucobacter chromiireducens]|uniref:DUF4126 domain-containing protein n=1 Tax=Leucobacter chromiireducens subsp. chromiireducens TaxID=660067 RepID=A0ABS1SRF1_9MICO|nr:DUF4126 domain-containing protein [Leucobacter chromiireducens]MBL3690719.1 DUF4126 domain-containing protein [Leucobacter chromiireducens subsp. chromiireducens]
MLEVITGTTLAASAGLNAYIPLLGLGLLSRFTSWVELPAGWAWLENGWSLGILGVLLLLEVIVDKVPALDSMNDILQTLVRPASGGMVFAAGAASDTVAVADPVAFADSPQFWPFLAGVVIALIPHLLKAIARPVLNVLTAGAGAAISSFLEDIGAVLLTILAVLVPLVALGALILVVVMMVRRLSRVRRMRAARDQAAT